MAALATCGLQADGPCPNKIPDPEKFDGTKSKLRPFIVQLQPKAASYPNEQDKLRLAINCLKGEAIEQVQSCIENDRVNLQILAMLITILETAFSNPNCVAERQAKLMHIQQGNWEFLVYYAEFQ